MTQCRMSVVKAGMLTLIAGSCLTTGCDMFRSTKMGYAGGTYKSQVRQGEVFTVKLYQAAPPPAAGPQVAMLGPGLVLASVVLEKVIGFASEELQKHLEKVAALHEASYEGVAVANNFDPSLPAELVISRWVKKDDSNAAPVVAMKVTYELEPVGLAQSDLVAWVVRQKPGTSVSMDYSAARLAEEKDPFNLDIALSFFTVTEVKETPKPAAGAGAGVAAAAAGGGGGGAGGAAAPAPAPPAPKTAAERKALGDPIKQSLLIPFSGLAVPTQPVPTGMTEVGSDALGFFVMSKAQSATDRRLLEVRVAVTEKDPSRAAERNKKVQEDLKDLTPQLVKYLQDQAGLTDPAKK